MEHAQEQTEQTCGPPQAEVPLVDGEAQDLALLYGPHLDQSAAYADLQPPAC